MALSLSRKWGLDLTDKIILNNRNVLIEGDYVGGGILREKLVLFLIFFYF